jgi:protein-disulfide isomerase
MLRPAFALLSSVLLAAACADPPPPKAPPPAPPQPPQSVARVAPVELPASSEIVPVDANDPIRGPKNAPVTVVVYSDFQCPFCARVEPTLAALLAAFPGKVRVVWKDQPLAFHKHAKEAAVLARIVFLARGEDAFWQFHDRVFEGQKSIGEELRTWAHELGVDDAAIDTHRAAAEAQVAANMEEAKRLGVSGTPHFLIDGEALVGSQPLEKFSAVVARHLERGAQLVAQGVAPHDLYATMVREYWSAPKPKADVVADAPPEDTSVYKVEIGNSPARGPKDALVTLVVFADYQCPFCRRVDATFAELDKAYPGKLRFVWKNQPLPFHARALPAALAAWEVYRQKGADAFFKMSAALFARSPKLEREDLEAAAGELPGIDVKKVLAAVDTQKWLPDIEDDQDQAASLKVSGTPHTFVNGRAVRGAQPLEKFKKVIDEELAKAEAKVKAGTPAAKVYAETIAQGTLVGGPVELAVPADAPWKGGAKAKVVVQVFSDFQCPFCKRIARTQGGDDATGGLEKVAKKYGDKIKVVWRDYPLPFHPRAMPAATLAREAKKQKGNEGFWKAHDELFDATSLDDASLEAIAKRIGLDWKKVQDAMAQQAWKDVIDADQKAGEVAGVEGTPAVFVNGRKIAGAQSEDVYVKAIDRALARAK